MNKGIKIGLIILVVLLILGISGTTIYFTMIKENFEPIPTQEEKPKEEIKKLDDVAWKDNDANFGEMEILDDGNNGNNGLHFNLCSKACCGAQYPLPFKMDADDITKNSTQKIGNSNITCRNSMQDAGCVCITPEQINHIYNRGGNTN